MKQETMKTTPEKSVETLAEEITVQVALICGCAWESCTAVREATKTAIVEALRARDARAARIAKTIPESQFDLGHEPALTEQQIRNSIATAIMEGKVS